MMTYAETCVGTPSQYIPNNNLKPCFIKQVRDVYHPKGVKIHTWCDKTGQWWMREMTNEGKLIRTVKLNKAPCSVKPDGEVRQKVLPSGMIVDEETYGIIFDYHKAHELPKGTWYND